MLDGKTNTKNVSYSKIARLSANDIVSIGLQTYSINSNSVKIDTYMEIAQLYVASPNIIANTGKLISGDAFQFDANGNGYPENYSLNEMRVGTWIDGKPLYKQTFNTGLIITDKGNTPIANVSLDFYIVKIDSCFYDNNDRFLTNLGDGLYATVLFDKKNMTGNNLNVYLGVAPGYTCGIICTLYYTKISDVAP